MISFCARPKFDRTHGLVPRCNTGFEVTALPLAKVSGYCKSEPLITPMKINFVNEKVEELPLLSQRTYVQRRGEDDYQATGISRSWNCTKYGIEHMIGYRESLTTDTRKPDLDPPTRQKVLVTLSLRAKAEKS